MFAEQMNEAIKIMENSSATIVMTVDPNRDPEVQSFWLIKDGSDLMDFMFPLLYGMSDIISDSLSYVSSETLEVLKDEKKQQTNFSS